MSKAETAYIANPTLRSARERDVMSAAVPAVLSAVPVARARIWVGSRSAPSRNEENASMTTGIPIRMPWVSTISQKRKASLPFNRYNQRAAREKERDREEQGREGQERQPMHVQHEPDRQEAEDHGGERGRPDVRERQRFMANHEPRQPQGGGVARRASVNRRYSRLIQSLRASAVPGASSVGVRRAPPSVAIDTMRAAFLESRPHAGIH